MVTRDVGLSGIAILPDRKRALRPEVVTEIADSMRQIGQLQPIVVRPQDGIGFYLVAGRHRYEAARYLKWESIRATIAEGMDADKALLAEIDENLVRANLSPAEEAAHHAARKPLYLKLHPKTKHGGAPGAGRGKGKAPYKDAKMASFVEDTAKKTEKPTRTVARSVSRGEHIPRIIDTVGTSLDQGDELDALAKMPAEAQATIIAKAMTGERVSAKAEVKKASRAAKEVALAAATIAASEKLGTKLYNVIYADPPWRFEPYSRDTGMDRAADNHYPTMTKDKIGNIEVPAAENCVLFLWATAPMLLDALDVMAAWGFEYKSHCVWKKDKIGTGYWFRNQHELLLVGTRGKIPAPAPGQQYSSVIEAKSGRHSEKPEAFAEMIDDTFQNSSSIELFGRKRRLGWDVWGAEAPAEETADA